MIKDIIKGVVFIALGILEGVLKVAWKLKKILVPIIIGGTLVWWWMGK